MKNQNNNNIYNKAFTEVKVILNYLEEKEYKKIPLELIEVINNNQNLEYNYTINNDLNLEKQKMLPETRAILLNIYINYLSNTEKKNKILKIQQEERSFNELGKKEEYKIDISQILRNRKNKY